MTDVRKLMATIAAASASLRRSAFVAPWVPGGRVRVRIEGLIHTFAPRRATEGWGIFLARDEQSAGYRGPASPSGVEAWLARLPAFRLRLVRHLRDMTWLAWAVNESDMRQRLGRVAPCVVHLVAEGGRFETVVARFDGAAWWFEAVDRRSDPRDAERLQQALLADPPLLTPWPGQTPEMRTAWRLACPTPAEPQLPPDPAAQLDRALRLGGGELASYREQGECYVVEWRARDGGLHQSIIARDLTVVSAGICLSGLDSTFDLQSLVNVVEGGQR